MEQRHVLSPGQARPVRLTPEVIARLLAAGLDPRGRGDAMLEELLDGTPRPGRPLAPGRAPRPASVLVPLVAHADAMTILLTQRTAHLAHHPGQISFPGGRLEECDEDSVACALRETEEEVGINARQVGVLGRLDDYVTGTGFVVTPVVGLVAPPFDLNPDPFEVAEVFEVPLAFVLDTANHTLHRRMVDGHPRPYWAMTWEQRLIWGATAGILVNLAEVLGRGD